MCRLYTTVAFIITVTVLQGQAHANPESQCPPDKPPVNCFVNPCDVTTCPAFPNAKCVADYCGECNARFFQDGKEVTEDCNQRDETCPIEGQVYKDCGTACPPTCDNPGPVFCTLQCVQGCQCPTGTLLDEKAVKCVKDIKECSDYCPIEGQVFLTCGTACPPTCAEPGPVFCTKQCVQGCQCPPGTLLDEKAGKCVNDKRKCTCPPSCTKDFCTIRGNENAFCNIPGPLDIPSCFGQCTVTSCSTCYYSKETRPLPSGCRTCGGPVDLSDRKDYWCFKRWARCIHSKDLYVYGEPSPECITQEKFKCYRYPCPLRG